jgi:hypothetical protein
MIACVRDVCSIMRLLSNGTKVIDTEQEEAILGNEKSNFKSHCFLTPGCQQWAYIVSVQSKADR